MAALRKSDPHETGEAKMKAAAIKAVSADHAAQPVPSPARQMQDQLKARYQPLSKRMAVILVSILMAFAFIGGWIGGSGTITAI